MPHILRRISLFRFRVRPNGSFVDGVGATKPNTVTMGQVKTRICRLGNGPTTSHHAPNRAAVSPLP